MNNQSIQQQDIKEDFSLINPLSINNPIKFFHQLIRVKYYNRIKSAYEQQNPKQKFFKGFLLIDDSHDHYSYYQQNFDQLKQFNQMVENNYQPLVLQKIRNYNNEKVKLQFKNQPSKSQQFKLEIQEMIEEFKLQIDLLIDSFDKAELYNLLDEQNFKKINKFGVNCNRFQDFLIPFFLNKFFGQLNEIASKIFVKVFVGLVSKMINVNIATWSSFLPDFNLFREDGWLGEKLEQIVFSKFFDTQKKQLLFLFGNLNTHINDYNLSIQKFLDSLFHLDKPLDYDQYLEVRDNINIKLKELNNFKLPKQNDQILNLSQIRNIVNLNLKEEVEQNNKKQRQDNQQLDHLNGIDAIQNFDLHEIKLQSNFSQTFEKIEAENQDYYSYSNQSENSEIQDKSSEELSDEEDDGIILKEFTIRNFNQLSLIYK